jgi:predicted dehydrogenase/threonine dehydrogenase-like Zn-dependent dehydrogenase
LKQLIQNLKTGITSLEEIPVPQPVRGQVLIQTTHTLVSLGTERMLVEFGKASLFQKARQQPDKVQQVLDKIRAEGLLPTLEAVFNKLDQPIPLGYCHVGVVAQLGDGVTEFQIGDRVVSNGSHAEFVCVPKNLVAKIPAGVSDEEASFAVIGSIGLQGLRLAQPTLGETVVVIGLGLIGLLTAQLAKANGCRVIGYDVDEAKVKLAGSLGIKSFNSLINDPIASVKEATQGLGADIVLITASAKGDEIIHQAALISRKRGRIVLIGVIGLDLKRSDFYEKELTFQVSCSYGPGRYDDNYEQKGNDYPVAFVRWTAQRNFESVLQAIESHSVNVKTLISEQVPFSDFQSVYGDMKNPTRIASLLAYPSQPRVLSRKVVFPQPVISSAGSLRAGIIGAGNFTKATLLPALKKNQVVIQGIASANGLSGTLMAKKYNAEFSTSDYQELLADEKVNLVIITTRHSLHAGMVIKAIQAGKNVFVEKPLAVNEEELHVLQELFTTKPQASLLHVGFNRRFSPHILQLKKLVGLQPGAMHLIITMNAGALPANHWTLDPKEGGRIIGEACHLVDLAVYLTGSEVASVTGQSLGISSNSNSDNASFLLEMQSGSNVVINYFANGSKAYSKERIELYYQERTLVMDNFRITTGYGWPGFTKIKTSIDKGHSEQIKQLKIAFESGEPLIPISQLFHVTAVTLAMVQSLKQNARISI